MLLPVLEHDKIRAIGTLFRPAAAVPFVLLRFTGLAIQVAVLAFHDAGGALVDLKIDMYLPSLIVFDLLNTLWTGSF